MKVSEIQEDAVAVIGAGMAGPLMAIYLARRGYRVNVFEKRPDPRTQKASSGRSVNLTLTSRGIHALAAVGLKEAVLAKAIPLQGRMVHRENEETSYQSYGATASEVLYSLRRSELNQVLLDAAEATPGVQMHFNHLMYDLEPDSPDLYIHNGKTNTRPRVRSLFTVGADGASSKVRQFLQERAGTEVRQEFFDWGYKELTLPAGVSGEFQLPHHALHLWPRKGAVLVAIPNPDATFTCNLILPLKGHNGLSTLTNESAVTSFFERQFPAVARLMPDLTEQWNAHPTSSFLTTRTSSWHYRDRIVLIGDACHAVFPFYGQGMNAALEDCFLLDQAIGEHSSDLAAAFAAFEKTRKPSTDALSELSRAHFLELRDHVASPSFIARKHIEDFLAARLPALWSPLYGLVAHTTLPYTEAIRRARRQNLIWKLSGLAGVQTVLVLVITIRARLRRRKHSLPPKPTRRIPSAA